MYVNAAADSPNARDRTRQLTEAQAEIDRLRLIVQKLQRIQFSRRAERLAYRDASTFANVAFPQTLTNPLVEVGRNFTAKLQHTF